MHCWDSYPNEINILCKVFLIAFFILTCRKTKKSKIDIAIPDDDDTPLAGPSFVNDDELSQLREKFSQETNTLFA